MSSWAQVSASGSHSRQLRRIHHTAYSPRSMKASFKIPNGSQAGDSTATKTIRETTGASISGRSGLKKRLSTGSHNVGEIQDAGCPVQALLGRGFLMRLKSFCRDALVPC